MIVVALSRKVALARAKDLMWVRLFRVYGISTWFDLLMILGGSRTCISIGLFPMKADHRPQWSGGYVLVIFTITAANLFFRCYLFAYLHTRLLYVLVNKARVYTRSIVIYPPLCYQPLRPPQPTYYIYPSVRQEVLSRGPGPQVRLV